MALSNVSIQYNISLVDIRITSKFHTVCSFLFVDIQNFESYAENRKDIERQQKDSVVEQLQSLVQNFQIASEKLSTSMSGRLLEMMQTELTTSMKR
jgi:hypothetical protein